MGFFSVFLGLGTSVGKSISEIIHSDFVVWDFIFFPGSALC